MYLCVLLVVETQIKGCWLYCGVRDYYCGLIWCREEEEAMITHRNKTCELNDKLPFDLSYAFLCHVRVICIINEEIKS